MFQAQMLARQRMQSLLETRSRSLKGRTRSLGGRPGLSGPCCDPSTGFWTRQGTCATFLAGQRGLESSPQPLALISSQPSLQRVGKGWNWRRNIAFVSPKATSAASTWSSPPGFGMQRTGFGAPRMFLGCSFKVL